MNNRLISATTLAKAYDCELAAYYDHQPKPNPYTCQDDFERNQAKIQGKRFEKVIEKNTEVWLKLLAKQNPEIKTPKASAVIQTNLESPENPDTWEDLDKQRQITWQKTEQWLKDCQPDKPKLLAQGEISDQENVGKPDMLLWTGEKLIILDNKHTTETKAGNAIQLIQYLHILRNTLKKLGLNLPIEKKLFIVHCPPSRIYGQRRADFSNIEENDIQLLSIVEEDASEQFKEVTQTIKEIFKTNQKPPNTFKAHCNTCEHRHVCYTTITPNIDKLPVSDSAVRNIKENYNALENPNVLAGMLKQYPTKEELEDYHQGNHDNGHYLEGKCYQIAKICASFNPFWKKAWETDYVIFARDFKGINVVNPGVFTPAVNNWLWPDGTLDKNFVIRKMAPAVIIVFSEEERCYIQKIIDPLRPKLTATNIITLQKELSLNYKGPLINTTLEGYERTFQNGFENIKQEVEKWSAEQQARPITNKIEHQDLPEMNLPAEKLAELRCKRLDKLWKNLVEIKQNNRIYCDE